MTPQKAAKIIGCSATQVRNLIRNGDIQADPQKMPGGFWYDIELSEVRRFKRIPQKQGFPRGQKRKKVK